MSPDKRVIVTLNSDSTGCFYTGDIVTGTVTLDIKNDHKIESIYLEVVGIYKAQWTRSMPTVPYIKIYSEKKKVLYVKTTDIFGGFRRGNQILAGMYSYPFHFALPVELPSTFQSSLAKVYYSIKIKSKPKYKIRKVIPFVVLGNVNINNVDELMAPCLYEFNKIFKSLAGKVTIHLKTYNGIAPKQTIPFEVTLINVKKIRISALNVTLVQKLRYTVSSGYAEEEKKLSTVTCKHIGKALTEICDFSMEIPQVAPSTIYMTDPMIDIAYVFRVEVCFPFHFNLNEDVPVTMASVPVIHYDF